MQFLIIDDHALIVQALGLLLKTKFPDAVVLTGSTADDARRLVAEHGENTDLLILDLNVPGVQTPTSLLEELVRTNSALKILVLSGIVDQQNIMRVLQLGAAGFVPKSLDTDMLTHAIDFVLQGGVYIPTRLLSESQKAGFLTQERICRELGLSEGTVKTHVSAIYRAFGATNRTEALIAARRAGFDITL